jgi:hypothetical protein
MRIFLGIMVLSLTAGILAAQTNRSGGTPTPPVAAHPSQSPDSAQGGPVHPSRPVLPGDIVQVETNAPATALLKELKERADLDHAMSPALTR